MLFFYISKQMCESCFRYDKREEAQEAINHLNGTIPDGGSEPLSVKIAEEHGKQKAAYYAGWQAGYNQSRGECIFTIFFFFLFLALNILEKRDIPILTEKVLSEEKKRYFNSGNKIFIECCHPSFTDVEFIHFFN